MRRKAGIHGLKKRQEQRSNFKKVGSEIQESDLKALQEQMKTFQSSLEAFAKKHKGDINKHPELRKHFHEMCCNVGVDPLQSSKGFWAEFLGIGSYYYELGIQVVDICLRTQKANGGVILLSEVKEYLAERRRGGEQEISEDDIERAVKTLEVLDQTFRLIKLGSHKAISSVATTLSNEQKVLMTIAQDKGYVSLRHLENELGWSKPKSEHLLDPLMQEGLVWIDTQMADGDIAYWFPSACSGMISVQ